MKPDKTDFFSIPFISRSDATDGSGRDRGIGGGRALAIDRYLARALLRVFGDPPVRIVLWDGQWVAPPHSPPRSGIKIRSRAALWRLVVNPGLNFGEEYSAGGIEADGDLVAFIETVYRTRLDAKGASLAIKALNRALKPVRRNSLARARDNIHHHYDIGNDFYRLWLDPELVYTCAYFPDAAATLERAQAAKMDHVCRKLQLKPGEQVVEAGCGWGALARHMARHYGVKVRAYNISHAQIAYAKERAKVEGLDDRVEYVEDDYRNITDTCDAFVSVGMLEHVGADNYGDLGKVIDRSLSPAGRGLIHTIGQNQASPLSPWLLKRIFPGAYPPTLRECMNILEPSGFSVLDVENLRMHYALTLEHWLERFERHAERVAEMFDERFVRTWRLYLCGSIANFRSGSLQLFQVLFSRPGNHDLPWTRAHLYRVGD